MINFLKNRKTPYLIGEISANHNSDIQIAKKLIDASFSCEWDCVKFQKRTVDTCIPENQKKVLKETLWGQMTYLEYRRKLEFNRAQYDYISQYCKEKPIDWSASIWDIDSLKFMERYDIPFIKIPSALLTDSDLLYYTARSFDTIILSTGMSTLEEIDKAVNTILKYNNNLILLHCNSSYPSPIQDVNLLMIPRLKERYNLDIGFSDHTYGLEASLAATVLGAKVIERHITLSHNMWGTDQKSSLEVHAMCMLKKRLSEINVMMGDGIKKVTQDEEKIKSKLRIG